MADDGELSAQIAARDSECSNFLTRKDKASALKACLVNPPVATKSEEIKVCTGSDMLCYFAD